MLVYGIIVVILFHRNNIVLLFCECKMHISKSSDRLHNDKVEEKEAKEDKEMV